MLDPATAVPLRVQLVEALRSAILGGALAADDVLPSTRAMARSLGISRGTVTSAFEQLMGEGYLEAAVGVGTRVSAGVRAVGVVDRTSGRGIHAPAVATVKVDARPGYPAPVALDSAWSRAWRTALAAATESRPHAAAGEPEFRAAIATHLRRFRGLAIDPDDVVVTGGSSDAFLLLGLALGRGAVVAVENPGYPRARTVLERAGATLAPIDSSQGRMDVAALSTLEPTPVAALVTPSHHYPLGGVLPVPDRLDLLEWARRSGAIVIEDDYDSEFRHVTQPLPAIASLDTDGRVALVGSFSKVLSTRLRCGYIIARGDFGERVRQVREELDSPVSVVQQFALAHYLESGGLARSVARSRRIYSHRRSLILRELGAEPGLTISALDGGLHVVVRSAVSDFASRLADRGILVEPLSRYGVDAASPGPAASLPGGFVMGYGACGDLDLSLAIDEIRDIHRSQ